MKDIDIRKKLKSIDLHLAPGNEHTKVVDELEIGYGDTRIDLAVINGSLHGYEIKSNHDTLIRLEKQITEYSKVFDFLTFAIGDKHINAASKLIPSWCGLIKVSDCKESPDGLHFETIHQSDRNSSVDNFTLAQFLWKEECITLLSKKSITKGVSSKSRIFLWKLVAETFSHDELPLEVRTILKARLNWR